MKDAINKFKNLVSGPKPNRPSSIASVLNVHPYRAPELTGLQNWINSEALTLEGLRGQVVLVDIWTFGCINCVRTLPYVEQWYQKFKDQGFVVIGVHSPEFDAEKVLENVQRAVTFRKLTYPIAQDNDMKNWRAYQNNYWPAQYLIDKQGMVRRVHFGEGEYAESEEAIAALLAE